MNDTWKTQPNHLLIPSKYRVKKCHDALRKEYIIVKLASALAQMLIADQIDHQPIHGVDQMHKQDDYRDQAIANARAAMDAYAKTVRKESSNVHTP